MGTQLTGTFATRREAEMTVERLVQEFELDRGTISISTENAANSAGEERAGSDNATRRPGERDRDDAALAGAIVVTAEVSDKATAEKVRSAFGEFDADAVVESGQSSA